VIDLGGRGPGGDDHDAAIGLFADGLGAQVGVGLDGQVDDAPFGGGHRLQLDPAAGLDGLLGDAVGDVFQPLDAALAVVADVDEDAELAAAHGTDDQVLQGVEGLTLAADQGAAVFALHGEEDLLVADLAAHLVGHAEGREKAFQGLFRERQLGLAVAVAVVKCHVSAS
jgi:hypothetical protein